MIMIPELQVTFCPFYKNENPTYNKFRNIDLIVNTDIGTYYFKLLGY